MEQKSPFDLLAERVDALLVRMEDLERQNEELKKELLTCRTAAKGMEEELQRLKEELIVRDLEIEEIIKKIETYLG
jgi:cell division protein ZapB